MTFRPAGSSAIKASYFLKTKCFECRFFARIFTVVSRFFGFSVWKFDQTSVVIWSKEKVLKRLEDTISASQALQGQFKERSKPVSKIAVTGNCGFSRRKCDQTEVVALWELANCQRRPKKHLSGVFYSCSSKI